MVKNTPANAEDTGDVGSIPGLGRSPGEGNGKIHSSILAWKIPRAEEPEEVFPGGSVSKESACNEGDHLQCRRPRFDPWVRRRKWQPTPLFLHGKCHGQRSLVGYSPWSCKELNMT